MNPIERFVLRRILRRASKSADSQHEVKDIVWQEFECKGDPTKLQTLADLDKGVATAVVETTEPSVEDSIVDPTTPIPKEDPEVLYKNFIDVHLRDGTKLGWVERDWKGPGRIGPWLAFYKWFFGRIDSPSFVFNYTGGETMFQRKDILTFNVHIEPARQEVNNG
jgi:hypothetical protein